MITHLWEPIENVLDWLFEILLSPLMQGISHGLETTLLKPMTLLHVPVAGQLIIIAILTAALSVILRGKLNVAAEDAQFRQRFAELKMGQQPIETLEDWKARDVLYRSSDNLIDEEYNSYLAQRFSKQMLIYLLPIFAVLFWLESVLPTTSISLWEIGINSVRLVPVSLVFLTAYVTALITMNVINKRLKVKKGSGNSRDYLESKNGNNTGAGRRFGFHRTNQKDPRTAISQSSAVH